MAHEGDASGSESRYTVRPGDTLWSIAVDRYAGDPRAGVYDLEQRNGLASPRIRVGQILRVP